jgi:hypothetical protein
MRRIAVALLVALSATFPCKLLAQREEALRAGVNRRVPAGVAPVLSVILPGAGQFTQKKQRFLVYASVEALYWWRYSKDVSERRRSEADFKDLARRVARAHFRPNTGDGDWTYYETMRDYLESGNFSTVESGIISPETDSLTYNGHLWQLIRRLTPGCTDAVNTCAQALPEYERRAISADRQWSWRNSQLQFDLFRRTTELRNDADHAMKQDLAVVALNHLLSMVDAFAVFRLESHMDSHGRPSVGAKLTW